MNFNQKFMKCSILACLLCSSLLCRAEELSRVVAAQWSGDDRNHTLRHRVCLENKQYQFQGRCCLNCPAGTFVQKECDQDMNLGTCEPCELGLTFTEHSNGMPQCLHCTHCRMDQIQTAACTHVADTQCQCRGGTFCVPEQACEVCKRCAKCKADEEVVKKCTHISNTVCRKRNFTPTIHPQTPSIAAPSPPDTTVNPWVMLLLPFLVLVGIGVWLYIKRPCRSQPVCLSGSGSHCDSSEIVKIPIDESGPTAEERQNSQNAGLEGEDRDEGRPESRPLLLQETQGVLIKASPPSGLGEDDDRGLGDSLPNTTSSSQASLSSSPQPSPPTQRLQPTAGDDPLQKRLVPLLGEETSLRKSFDLFDEELDVRIHNKFFRYIGVHDNHIKMAENARPCDKVYDLLKNWMQKEGLKADINALLQALLSLDQRRSAESIAFAAIQRGYYKHEDTP
ncbi:hypothetical protein UPYG_G00280400 [Umbra pygmaea]|uniref:Uncharacterized protein n=1 Tax=Umbra pygmaea TaxID=75934 RepID=A0ABD0W3P3_UMBPY